MLKYKQKIQEHITDSTEQLELLVSDVEYNRINRIELVKRIQNVVNKLNHSSDLVDLEEG